MALSDAEMQAAANAERPLWSLIAEPAPGGPPSGWSNTLDDAAVRIRTTLLACAHDAARRLSVETGQTAWPFAKDMDVFFASCVRLGILAVANPSASDTVRLTRAGLA